MSTRERNRVRDDLPDTLKRSPAKARRRDPTVLRGVVPAGGAITYRPPALAAGSNTFRCTIDPTMTGDFIVAEVTRR